METKGRTAQHKMGRGIVRKGSGGSNSSGRSRCQLLLASMDTADILAATGGKPTSVPTSPALKPKVTLDSQLSVEVPRTVSGKIELEIQRVRQQITDMADQLKEAFANEKYEQVKVIGEKKKELEEKLKRFEEQYSNDKVFYEMESIKQDITSTDGEMKQAFQSESYAAVAELGIKKKELQNKLAELESNFGLHNSVFQVGDRVSVTGLTSPRGGVYNGLEGVITEYLPEEQRYKVVVKEDGGEKTCALQGKNLSHAEQADDTASVKSGKSAKSKTPSTVAGKSQTRQLEGEIKLWFPRKHFGFITPDNKPENEPDIFFHGTHVENREEMPIKRFARVKFSVIPAPKGPQARDVSIIAYQPEKEQEAEAAEAAAKSPKEDKVTRPDQRKKTTASKRSRKKKKATSDAGFTDEINIEDPLGPVSPEALGLGMGGNPAVPSWAKRMGSDPKRAKPAYGRKGGSLRTSLNARAKPFLSSIDEKRQSRAYATRGTHPPPPGWSRSGSVGAHARQPRDHRNWGSLSSEMGTMRWDSIRSVGDFFAARASAGPVKSNDHQKGPPPSILGRGRQADPTRAALQQTDEILAQIRPELFKHHYGVFAAQAKEAAELRAANEVMIPSGGRKPQSYSRTASIDLRKQSSPEEKKAEEPKPKAPQPSAVPRMTI